VQEVFTTTADPLARRTGFVQRTSKLTGALFAQTLVFGWLSNPQASLDGRAPVAAAVGVTSRAQALDARCTAGAAVFLENLLARAVQTVIAADPVALPLRERFMAVVLLDSATSTRPAARALWWPGCSAGTAALTRPVRYELWREASGFGTQAGCGARQPAVTPA